MEENGYVFSPLDLKILLLFLLRRLPSEIESERLMLLCQEDGVVSYFDYTIGLEELCESGQITLEEGWCRITDRGRVTAEALESSLPYSVRFHAEQTALAEAERMQRDNSISASHGSEETGCHVELRLNDGISDILSLRLLCADETQAREIEKNFRRHAEDCYQKIVSLLSETE
jgi:hypothetical protein